MRIEYLDGARLRRALVAGCECVQHRRGELNRINVFPVPDGDTGTNLALTASAIADHLRTIRSDSLSRVAHEAADAAILGARGNCGMILSHFLLGFSQAVAGQDRVDASRFADAMTDAVAHVYRSLERPIEGTIITVMRATAEHAKSAHTTDFADLLDDLLAEARVALEQTPELLPALKLAGVVDAGAKGFVHLLEGMHGFVHGEPFVALEQPALLFEPVAAAMVAFPTESEKYRFCTEALVRGQDLPASSVVQDKLRELGDSMIVIRGSDVLKVHIHTDHPETVFQLLRGYGELATHKAEDMQVQHAAVERAAAAHVQLARRPVSLVTDSACDLPDEVLRAHGIHVVPMALVFGDQVYRDRIDITAATFVERLRKGERATTSQPPPAAFLEAYRKAAEDGETVIAIMVASKLSGTFASAEAAAKRMNGASIRLFDSRGASLTQGMLTLRAAELAEAGRTPDQIIEALNAIRDRSGIIFTVDVFDNLLASGRVGRGQVMIAGLLDIKPILEIRKDGTVGPVTKVRGRKNVLPRMIQIVRDRVPASANVRFGIVHVGAEETARAVGDELHKHYGAAEFIVSPATPVLATHIGPGAWGVAYQIDD